MGMHPKLYRENIIVLMLLQAMIGQLSNNVKALSVEFDGEDVVAHFLLREDNLADREEIFDNLPTEVSVLTNGVPGVGEVLVRPGIELVAERPPGFRPPGRIVLLFRD
jgi:hypothetical protein